MEPVAFLEIVGRHGEVAVRHPIWRWPSRIGRSYEMDIVLDDPFVAPGHLEIRERPDGKYEVEDLQSINGMLVVPSREKRTRAEIGPEDVIRIGHTQLRIRPRSYVVSAERPMQRTGAFRRPVLFLILAALLLVTIAWMATVDTSYGDDKEVMVSIVSMELRLGAIIAAWVAIWSLVSRTIGGRANLAAHGIVACASLIAGLIWESAVEYIAFGLDASWLEPGGWVGVAVVFAYMMYRHLRLTSRAQWRIHAALAMFVSFVLFVGDSVLTNLQVATYLTAQSYSSNLKAPVFVMVPGVLPEVFLGDADTLKREVDSMASE